MSAQNRQRSLDLEPNPNLTAGRGAWTVLVGVHVPGSPEQKGRALFSHGTFGRFNHVFSVRGLSGIMSDEAKIQITYIPKKTYTSHLRRLCAQWVL